MSRLGNQRHLASIRDAFAISTPILIIGSLAVLWRNVLFTTWNTTEGTLPNLWLAFNQIKEGSNGLTGAQTAGGAYDSMLGLLNGMMVWIQVGIINFLALYVVFGIGYFLSQSKGHKTPLLAGLTALASFMAVTNTNLTVGWETGFYWLGARGLLSGLIVAMLSTELLCWLSKSEKMKITMPDGVPPAVGRAFTSLIPIMLTIFLAGAFSQTLAWFTGAINWDIPEGAGVEYSVKAGTTLDQVQVDNLKALGATDEMFNGLVLTEDFAFRDPNANSADFQTFLIQFKDGRHSTGSFTKALSGGVTFTSFVYGLVVSPFTGLAASSNQFAIGLALLYVMLVSFFWFFGLHGTNIANGIFLPVWTLLWAENLAGTGNHKFAGPTFDAFIFLGGWGATLPLVIATLIFGKKDSAQREVSKFAIAPGIFNINEPVTFGFPLVLNGLLAIPLFFIQPVLVFTSYFGMRIFDIIPKYSVPWTTPAGFGGLIATGSGWGFVLAFINLIIAAALWTPFVFMMKWQDAQTLKDAALSTEMGAAKLAKDAKLDTVAKTVKTKTVKAKLVKEAI